MKKIILIDHEPYTVHRGNIFYMDYLISCGFEVEVWDISAYLYADLNLYKGEDVGYLYRFSSQEQLAEQLGKTEIPGALFIVEVPNHWKNRKIFKLLKDYGCYTIRLSLYEASNLPPLPLLKRLKYVETGK